MLIHKYALHPYFQGDEPRTATVRMPEGSRVLSVGAQAGTGPCLWANVNETAQKTDYRFWLVPTGLQVAVPKDALFHGRIDWQGLVFHVFGEDR